MSTDRRPARTPTMPSRPYLPVRNPAPAPSLAMPAAVTAAFAAAGLLLLGSGCTGSDHVADEPSSITADPIPLEAFCGALAETLCARVARCRCHPETETTCRAGYEGQCAQVFAEEKLATMLSDGLVRYDERAAGALIERLDADESCRAPVEVLRWTVRDHFTFGGVLDGTLTPGEDCEPQSLQIRRVDACRLGSCDARRCVGFVDDGGSCDGSHTCKDLGRLVDRLGREPAVRTLRCEGSTTESAGFCQPVPLLTVGDSCSQAGQCATGHCSGNVCADPLGLGAPCERHEECGTGYCDAESGPARCAARQRLAGAACTSDWECATQSCVQGRCGDPICTDYDLLRALY